MTPIYFLLIFAAISPIFMRHGTQVELNKRESIETSHLSIFYRTEFMPSGNSSIKRYCINELINVIDYKAM